MQKGSYSFGFTVEGLRNEILSDPRYSLAPRPAPVTTRYEFPPIALIESNIGPVSGPGNMPYVRTPGGIEGRLYDPPSGGKPIFVSNNPNHLVMVEPGTGEYTVAAGTTLLGAHLLRGAGAVAYSAIGGTVTTGSLSAGAGAGFAEYTTLSMLQTSGVAWGTFGAGVVYGITEDAGYSASLGLQTALIIGPGNVRTSARGGLKPGAPSAPGYRAFQSQADALMQQAYAGRGLTPNGMKMQVDPGVRGSINLQDANIVYREMTLDPGKLARVQPFSQTLSNTGGGGKGGGKGVRNHLSPVSVANGGETAPASTNGS